MPCVFLKTSRLKDVLSTLNLPPCNWLISGLDCYDHCGWEGCEKWAKEVLFLSDTQFRDDVNLRDMQFIWGVFSAIPASVSKNEIEQYPLPETQIPYYMSNHIAPQHPMALLEIYAFDGCYVFVSSSDGALLKPLYQLPYDPVDEEANNRKLNAQLRQIQDCLRRNVPDVSGIVANEVQWKVWRRLCKNRDAVIEEHELSPVVMEIYREVVCAPIRYPFTMWDPYLQEP